MPILTCPHCGVTTRVADQYAGQTGPCASCGKTVTVPPLGGEYAPPAKSGAGISVGVIVLIVLLVMAIPCGGILVALLLPAISGVRDTARRTACANNLHQIGVAMQMFESSQKQFPPAYKADPGGKPLHSWRVLLLPYLEQDSLYRQIRLNEPWDSPHNRQFHNMMPEIYRCPGAMTGDRSKTSYVAISGRGTAFDGSKGKRMAEFINGLSNTVVVIELPESDINWMEPRDLDIDQIEAVLADSKGKGLKRIHARGLSALFGDGRVELLEEISVPELKRKATIRGEAAERMPFGPP